MIHRTRYLASALLLLALAGCQHSLPDRITDAKATYAATFDALKLADQIHPFPPAAKKAVGNSLAAVESQIDAADESHKAGDDGNAAFWIGQAEAGLHTANKLTTGGK